MPVTASPDLLVGQWRAAPNLQGVVQTFLDALREEAEEPMEYMARQRRIETGEGVWLDYIARRFGVSRPYTTRGATDPRFGFDMAGEPFDNAPFAGDDVNAATAPIGDPLFKRFLRARAITLLGRGDMETFDKSVKEIDSSALTRDNHDMTVTVRTDKGWQIELADAGHYLPRQAGVRMNVEAKGAWGMDDAGQPFDRPTARKFRS